MFLLVGICAFRKMMCLRKTSKHQNLEDALCPQNLHTRPKLGRYWMSSLGNEYDIPKMSC